MQLTCCSVIWCPTPKGNHGLFALKTPKTSVKPATVTRPRPETQRPGRAYAHATAAEF
ncbi:MAG: hypothetical protein LV479_05395 [Methylacidiphilales bacterium]|nr:hypothetical protein [Candidatus Methylacidiphilales bacterium]